MCSSDGRSIKLRSGVVVAISVVSGESMMLVLLRAWFLLFEMRLKCGELAPPCLSYAFCTLCLYSVRSIQWQEPGVSGCLGRHLPH